MASRLQGLSAKRLKDMQSEIDNDVINKNYAGSGGGGGGGNKRQ